MVVSSVGGGKVGSGGGDSGHLCVPEAAPPFNRRSSSLGGVGGQGFEGVRGVPGYRFVAASIAARWMEIVAEVGGTCRMRGLGSWVGMGVAGECIINGHAWAAPAVELASIGVHENFFGGDFGGVWTTVVFALYLCVPLAGAVWDVSPWMSFAFTSRAPSGMYVLAGSGPFDTSGSNEDCSSKMASGN